VAQQQRPARTVAGLEAAHLATVGVVAADPGAQAGQIGELAIGRGLELVDGQEAVGSRQAGQ